MVNERDMNLLSDIIRQCKIMNDAVIRLKLSPEILADDGFFYNGCCETVFQIGELVKSLSTEFKQEYDGQPWQRIYGMRNIIGHHYGQIKLKLLWETITENIPELRAYCENIVKQGNGN